MSNLSSYDVVVFDLDDTLYSEKQYVLSGYKYLAKLIEKLYSKNTYQTFLKALELEEDDVFAYVIEQQGLPLFLKEHLILAYRYHVPNLRLHEGALTILQQLKRKGIPMYIITDGRGITQRLKITALEIESFFESIFISEEVGVGKPALDSFQVIQKAYPNQSIVYVADNPKKDFLAPLQLGWDAIGVLHENSRVHPLTNDYIQTANVWLDEFKELLC